MAYGLLFLRVVLGLPWPPTVRKLSPFGGGGLQGTAGFFGSNLRFRPLAMAFFAGLGEFGGGLLSPSAPDAARCGRARLGDGDRDRDRALGKRLLRAATVQPADPRRRDRDRRDGGPLLARPRVRLGRQLSGLWWGVGVLVVGIASSALTVVAFRKPATA